MPVKKKYNAERIASALNGELIAEGRQRLIQIGMSIFGQPELLAELGFDKLKHEFQMATIVWVEKNKGLFRRGVSPEQISKFSRGIIVHPYDLKAKADVIAKRYSLHQKTPFFPHLAGKKSVAKIEAFNPAKHDIRQEKIDFYSRYFEALSPEIAILLFRTVITRSKDRVDLNRFRSGGKDFFAYRHILTMCTYRINQSTTLKSQFRNMMLDNADWRSFKVNYPNNLIFLLPEPNSPNYFSTVEKAQAAFGEKIERLLKPKKARTTKSSKEKVKQSTPAAREVDSFILPCFEPSNIKRTVTISEPENPTIFDGSDEGADKAQTKEVDGVIDERVPAEDYKTLVDNSVNPSNLGSKIFSFADEETQVPTSRNQYAKNLAQPKTTTIQVRDGSQNFRENILRLYSGRCCVSSCTVETVLEAAHIQDHAEGRNNDFNNGICLRRDIHTLFDRGLLKINTDYLIMVDDSLAGSEYMLFDGQKIHLPKQQIDYPKKSLLEWKLSKPSTK